jgi:hypothetical protein
MTKKTDDTRQSDPFAGYNSNLVMRVNGLSCILNMPKALEQKFVNGEESVMGLPPHNRRPAFVVDEYPACPPNWMKGTAEASSYFVPVLAEHGLWLDFNLNSKNTHHVAAVISVQGVNAITGQQTDKMRLEQYNKKCPVHKKEFGHERFCEECGFKWPKQNYLASNATPGGYFWLDGFRAQDGHVRQYIFTEEVIRGVAAQVIGEDRVFSIGVAFYLSKDEKPIIHDMGVPISAKINWPVYGGTTYRTHNLMSLNKKYMINSGPPTDDDPTYSVNNVIASYAGTDSF